MMSIPLTNFCAGRTWRPIRTHDYIYIVTQYECQCKQWNSIWNANLFSSEKKTGQFAPSIWRGALPQSEVFIEYAHLQYNRTEVKERRKVYLPSSLPLLLCLCRIYALSAFVMKSTLCGNAPHTIKGANWLFFLLVREVRRTEAVARPASKPWLFKNGSEGFEMTFWLLGFRKFYSFRRYISTYTLLVRTFESTSRFKLE